MNPDLPDAAAELGSTATRLFERLGAVDIARGAEKDPSHRRTVVADALRRLGTEDLDPRADADALAAAAALCEAAGRVALPYPVPAVLLGDGEGVPFAVVPHDCARVDHGDLFDEWRVATLHGPTASAVHKGGLLGSRLGPFVTDLVPDGREQATAEAGGAPGDVALNLVLSAWQVLGTVERAVELAVEHVSGRIQFAKPLAAFQAVQFQLADAAVAAAGLRELAHFTLWRLTVAPSHAAVDGLALRLHALEVARAVLRTAQQLHGAAGVCDEYDISVLCRHVQPLMRLPFGAERTAVELGDAIESAGFAGLFAHGRVGP
ncbi:MAG: acyl-CoA dehydrogenase family protein [Acidimicrobiales bacterium]